MNKRERVTYAPDGTAGGAPAGGAPAGGAVPAAAGAAAPAAGGGGGGGAGGGGAVAAAPAVFADSLPEDIRYDAVFRDIKDLGGLAKGYKNAQQLIGKIGANPDSVVAIPGEEDSEGWNGLFNKLGRPESADKYSLGEMALPEGMKADLELQKGFTSKAHELGLSNKQAQGLFAWWNENVGSNFTQQTQAAAAKEQQGISALRTEWGQAFDQKLGDAKSALAHYGGEDLTAYLEESRLGNDPRMIKVFATLGAQLREDGIAGRGSAGAGMGVLSPTEARQEIAKLQGDTQFSKQYLNKSDPAHQQAVQRMKSLHEMAYPG